MVVLTVDLNSSRNRKLAAQYSRTDKRDCTACQTDTPNSCIDTKLIYAGIGSVNANWDMSNMTWDYLKRIRETTSMKIVIKGIITAEDAASAIGRAYILLLAAFGIPGVEKVLEILKAGLSMVMGQMLVAHCRPC